MYIIYISHIYIYISYIYVYHIYIYISHIYVHDNQNHTYWHTHTPDKLVNICIYILVHIISRDVCVCAGALCARMGVNINNK